MFVGRWKPSVSSEEPLVRNASSIVGTPIAQYISV